MAESRGNPRFQHGGGLGADEITGVPVQEMVVAVGEQKAEAADFAVADRVPDPALPHRQGAMGERPDALHQDESLPVAEGTAAEPLGQSPVVEIVSATLALGLEHVARRVGQGGPPGRQGPLLREEGILQAVQGGEGGFHQARVGLRGEFA